MYRKHAGHASAAIDAVGWSDNHWLHLRAPQHGGVTLLSQVARLTKVLVEEPNVPYAVTFFLTMGGLTALNKVSEEEQEELLSQGKTRAIRPINAGVTFLKKALKLASLAPSGRRVRRALSRLNLGIGAPGGPETMYLIAQAAYLSGAALVIDDCANGFNELLRQAVIDSV